MSKQPTERFPESVEAEKILSQLEAEKILSQLEEELSRPRPGSDCTRGMLQQLQELLLPGQSGTIILELHGHKYTATLNK